VSAELKSCMMQLGEVKRDLLERELIISHMEETIVRDLLFSSDDCDDLDDNESGFDD
jgi:hypothetical protein